MTSQLKRRIIFILLTSLQPINVYSSKDTLVNLFLNNSKKIIQDEYKIFEEISKRPIQTKGISLFCWCGITNNNNTLRDALLKVNYFRKLVGLHSVCLENLLNEYALQAAFLMNKNGMLSHNPDSNWRCFNSKRYFAAHRSLLGFYNANKEGNNSVTEFIQDFGKENALCGHRRWLLWSKLDTIGIGITKKAEAIYIDQSVDGSQNNTVQQFISYPASGYFPKELIYERFTLSIAVNRSFLNMDNVSVNVFVNDKKTKVKKIITDYSYGDPVIIFEVPSLFEVKKGNKRIKEEIIDHSINVIIENIIINNLNYKLSYSIIPV